MPKAGFLMTRLILFLQGYGSSPKASVDRAKYLEEVIKGLKLKKPVIVSPSMSGGYSMPYLFAGKAIFFLFLGLRILLPKFLHFRKK